MKLRRWLPIYNCDGMYLYEIIEDYKHASTCKEQEEIFSAFCEYLWASKNKRRIYTKAIHFKVRKDLQDSDPGRLFQTWSDIEYKSCKSRSAENDWCSILRQKINNIYTIYFDSEVILDKEYMEILKFPKKLYYEWSAGKPMDTGTLEELLKKSCDDAQIVRQRLKQQKMSLSWTEYKKIAESFLHTAFHNCRLIDDFESKSSLSCGFDFLTEDHFYIKYFSRSLDGEIRKWQKKYYKVRDHRPLKRCPDCGALIEKTGNKKIYCTGCANLRKKRSNKASDKKYKERMRENRNSSIAL